MSALHRTCTNTGQGARALARALETSRGPVPIIKQTVSDRAAMCQERQGIRSGAGKMIKSRIFGDRLGKKEDGIVRLAYEQLGGMAPWVMGKYSKIPGMK